MGVKYQRGTNKSCLTIFFFNLLKWKIFLYDVSNVEMKNEKKNKKNFFPLLTKV